MIIVCLITTPTKKDAQRIARELVRLRLAACVNIMDSVESHFFWKGKIEKSKEALLFVKTLKSKFQTLKKKVEQMHPYTTPEIIGLPVAAGNARYIHWLKEAINHG